jgi:hypothetical protein
LASPASDQPDGRPKCFRSQSRVAHRQEVAWIVVVNVGEVPEGHIGSVRERRTGWPGDFVRQVVVAVVGDKGLARLFGSKRAEVPAVRAAAPRAAFRGRILAKARRIAFRFVGLDYDRPACDAAVANPPPALGAAGAVVALAREISGPTLRPHIRTSPRVTLLDRRRGVDPGRIVPLS